MNESVIERRAWNRAERYQELVELAPDGILIHDGVRIVLVNAAAVRLAGATHRAQLVGRPIEAFLDPPYLKAVQAQLTDAISPAEAAPPVRDTFRRLDGSTIEVEVRAVAFMEHGRPSAHLVVRDITERLAVEESARQIEERLRQAQRMESVGALAGGVAHEVNNMLQVILGFGDFLLGDTRLPEASRADVQEITRAAGRAAAVTRQLLAYSRRTVHRPKAIDISATVRDAAPMVRLLLGEGRQLIVRTGTTLMACVDPGHLEQVIINLALNARDAMPAGGSLAIGTADTEAPEGLLAADGSAIPAGPYATLLVHDTGSGMDAATMAQIFEPFFTTKAVGQGTGLGLAAAQGLLTQNGGFITVASEPGRGTTFTVYLPRLHEADRSGLPAEPACAASANTPVVATVIVVDDEPALGAAAARSLERAGFRVRRALNGGEALMLIDRHGPPDLVLSDWMMPGIGGAELARRLRARWPALPIIFMSGYSSEELQRHGALDTTGELIHKPCLPERLVAAVTAALERARRATPPPTG